MQRNNENSCHQETFVMQKFFFLFLIIALFISCRKNTNSDCTNATVTLKATNCKRVGVIIKGIAYPTNDLPEQYAIDGKSICIEYSLYDDRRMCVCCGGTYVHIIKVN